jgi:hypothetical protein
MSTKKYLVKPEVLDLKGGGEDVTSNLSSVQLTEQERRWLVIGTALNVVLVNLRFKGAGIKSFGPNY